VTSTTENNTAAITSSSSYAYMTEVALAERNLTNEYLQIRHRYNHKTDSPTSSLGDSIHSTSNTITDDGTDLENPNSVQFDKKPMWYLILNNVKDNMKKIETGCMLYSLSLQCVTIVNFYIIVKVLVDLHSAHTTFNMKKDFSQEEKQVNGQTLELKQLFIDCKHLLERIDTSAEPKSQEEVMKRNLKISLVNELNTLSLKFRDDQQEYLKNLERLKAKRRTMGARYDDREMELDPEERERIEAMEQKLQMDPGFTDDQIRQLILNEQDIIRRDRELRAILTSIVELNELFKEFNQLVVEQGTLLDRIDYNVENTFHFVQEANEQLTQAEKYQKMSRMTLFILLLVLLFVFLGVFLALKFM
jgi:syntaxin 16